MTMLPLLFIGFVLVVIVGFVIALLLIERKRRD